MDLEQSDTFAVRQGLASTATRVSHRRLLEGSDANRSIGRMGLAGVAPAGLLNGTSAGGNGDPEYAHHRKLQQWSSMWQAATGAATAVQNAVASIRPVYLGVYGGKTDGRSTVVMPVTSGLLQRGLQSTGKHRSCHHRHRCVRTALCRPLQVDLQQPLLAKQHSCLSRHSTPVMLSSLLASCCTTEPL
jgi:hypothetical protein